MHMLYLWIFVSVMNSLSIVYIFRVSNSTLVILSNTYSHTSRKLHKQDFFKSKNMLRWRFGDCNYSRGGIEGRWFGALKGVSDPSAWAPRAQQDQCVWSQASSAHNEGKWEFNTNFLTKSPRPPACVARRTSRHPQLHHHHLHYNQNKNYTS